MQIEGIAAVEFLSATTQGVVNIELGYVPDFCILISNHKGANPDIRFWLNKANFPGWNAADDSILDTGSSGILTQDTASMSAYAGNEAITAIETEQSDPKTLRPVGTVGTVARISSSGMTIPAGDQVSDARNLLLAFRLDYRTA